MVKREGEGFQGFELKEASHGLGALFDAAERSAAAVRAAQAIPDDEDEPRALRFMLPAGWESEIVDLEPYQDRPYRQRGTATFDRVESFIEYVDVYKDSATLIYARNEWFVAILNGHTAAKPGWCDHLATFTLKETPEWAAWRSANAGWMKQEEFAEFLEDRLGEIAEPDGATLLEIATTLKAKTQVHFQSQIKLSNGQVQMRYEEEVDGIAGHKGDLAIPERLKLVVQPYDGEERARMEARFRWRIARNGEAVFRYELGGELHRVRSEILDLAAKRVAERTGVPVLFGEWRGW